MARSAEVISHWHLLIDDFHTSALEFYTTVEQEVARREVPDVGLERVDWREGGLVSAKREYLRVGRGKLTFDICAAPFGKSYFFSWWLAEQPPQNALLYGCLIVVGLPITLGIAITAAGFFKGVLLFLALAAIAFLFMRGAVQSGTLDWEDTFLAIPYLGTLFRLLFKPVTYYATDTRLMFQESVHRAVTDVIAGLRTARGLRALSAEETRPMMRDLLR